MYIYIYIYSGTNSPVRLHAVQCTGMFCNTMRCDDVT